MMPGSGAADTAAVEHRSIAGARSRSAVASRLLVVVALFAVLLAPSPAQAQTVGTSEISVEVDPARGVIVTERLGGGTRTATVPVVIPPEAVDITVDVPVTARTVIDGFRQWDLEVGSGGATITYVLTSTSGRAVDGTRINDAMVGFHLWPSLDTVEVEVTLPRGFVANMGPAFVPTLVADETLRYRLDSTDRSLVWGLWFVAHRDSGLVTRTVDLDNGTAIVVAAWADDPEWMAFATRYVEDGVPQLEELTGLEWPIAELRLVESVAPTQEGYGGWFDLRQSEILISDSLDPDIFLHELSHAWFNDLLLEDRWVIEGMAEAYAARARIVLEGEGRVAVAPDVAPAAIDGLNDWGTPLFLDNVASYESYGYRTSYWVIDRLLDELGLAGMRAVIADLHQDRHPYGLDTDPRSVGTNDWRRFLDLLEREAGSTAADGLFREYVVSADELALLDRRAEVLSRYQAFETSSGGLEAVPQGVRFAMARWEFDDAEQGVVEARRLRGELDGLASRADALGLELPGFLEETYRDSDLDFERIEDAIAETGELLTALERDPTAVDDATRRDFGLGRYERLRVDLSAAPPDRLNADRGGFDPGLFEFTVAGVVALGLLAAVVARQMSQERHQARTAIHTRPSSPQAPSGPLPTRFGGGMGGSGGKRPTIPTYLPPAGLKRQLEGDEVEPEPTPSRPNRRRPTRVNRLLGRTPPMPDDSMRIRPKRGRHSKY